MRNLTIIVLLVLLAVNSFVFMRVNDLVKFQNAQVGGEENLEKIIQIYSSEQYIQEQSAMLDASLAQFGITNNEEMDVEWNDVPDFQQPQVDPMPPVADAETILPIVEDIKNNNVVVWDEDAKFTIIEYTSPTCSFCQRQHTDKTLEKTLEQVWEENVNYVTVVYTRADVDTKVWETLSCALELSWEDTYLELLDTVFENGYSSVLDAEYTADKFDIDGLEECIEEQRYTQQINNQTQVAMSLFGVNGTPWNIVVNNETGEFKQIEWAHPVTTFVSTVNQMMGN